MTNSYSKELVERVAMRMYAERSFTQALWSEVGGTIQGKWRGYATAALDASHHSELVEVLELVKRSIEKVNANELAPCDLDYELKKIYHVLYRLKASGGVG